MLRSVKKKKEKRKECLKSLRKLVSLMHVGILKFLFLFLCQIKKLFVFLKRHSTTINVLIYQKICKKRNIEAVKP